jgi:hypothetical protein
MIIIQDKTITSTQHRKFALDFRFFFLIHVYMNLRDRRCHVRVFGVIAGSENAKKCCAYERYSRLHAYNDFLQLDRLKCENSVELCAGKQENKPEPGYRKSMLLSNMKYCFTDPLGTNLRTQF